MPLEHCDESSYQDQQVEKNGLFTPRQLVQRVVPAPEFCLCGGLILLIGVVLSVSGQDGGNDELSRDQVVAHVGRIEGLAISPDGSAVATASRDGAMKIWDFAGRCERGAPFIAKLGFTSIAFAPDGRTLATGGLDGKVTLWDSVTRERQIILSANSGAMRAVAFSPRGTLLAAAGDDGAVRIWDIPSGRETRVMKEHTGIVHGLAFSPEGATLASAGFDGQLILWDLGTGKVRDQFPGECGPLWSVAYSPDGQSLAFGGVEGITFREVSTGRSQRWRSLRGAVTAVRYLTDGTTLVSSSLSGAVALWDISGDRVRYRHDFGGQRGRMKAMGISPEGTTLVTGGDDGVLRFWNLTRGLQGDSDFSDIGLKPAFSERSERNERNGSLAPTQQASQKRVL